MVEYQCGVIGIENRVTMLTYMWEIINPHTAEIFFDLVNANRGVETPQYKIPYFLDNPFNDYYNSKMEKLINHFKDKLD